MAKYRMDIDAYGTRDNGRTFEVIVTAENEDMAFELGAALSDKYQELYPELGEEWDVGNVEKI